MRKNFVQRQEEEAQRNVNVLWKAAHSWLAVIYVALWFSAFAKKCAKRNKNVVFYLLLVFFFNCHFLSFFFALCHLQCTNVWLHISLTLSTDGRDAVIVVLLLGNGCGEKKKRKCRFLVIKMKLFFSFALFVALQRKGTELCLTFSHYARM